MTKDSMEIDRLFRQESGKMVAVMTKFLGFKNLEIAEDIVQDTFIQAFESWETRGLPDNCQGWLYTVAKNKATDYLRRQQVKTKVDQYVRTAIPLEYTITANLEQAFYAIKDNQLQLLFAVCHPAISEEAQIALALKTLGGFTAKEIARAFLTSEDTINKRLYRAKEKIRKEQIQLEIPRKNQLDTRISAVLKTIYLLYNEGYYSSSTEKIIRKDLCLEAMRLGLLLQGAELPRQRDISALLALMCFHTSRFESRLNTLGEMIPISRQDRSLWNVDLINRGIQYLQKLNLGALDSAYQIEAAIAYFHTMEESTEKWHALLALFKQLLAYKNNPSTQLNYALVISKAKGNKEAIAYLQHQDMPKDDYLFMALMGELHKEMDLKQALSFLESAIQLAPLQAEKILLQEKIKILRSKISE